MRISAETQRTELNADMSIEKAMQLIKGRFSFRLKKEFGYFGEVSQRGFSEVRINEEQHFLRTCLKTKHFVATTDARRQ